MSYSIKPWSNLVGYVPTTTTDLPSWPDTTWSSNYLSVDMNVYTDDSGAEEFIVEVVMPGLSKEDIKINVASGVLNITGSSKSDSMARRSYTYKHSVSLPDNIGSVDDIKANYEQGILTIKVPKLSESKLKEKTKEVKVT